jgi:hypothetical protein
MVFELIFRPVTFALRDLVDKDEYIMTMLSYIHLSRSQHIQ